MFFVKREREEKGQQWIYIERERTLQKKRMDKR